MESAPVGNKGRKRLVIGIGIAVVALLALTTTALAAGFAGINVRQSVHAPARFAPNATGAGGAVRPAGMFGPRGVVTAVNTTANPPTITLGGLPQQFATITVSANVKLATLQADGTTQPAAIGDFKVGTVVEVGVQFSGRPGRMKPGAPNGSSAASPSASAPSQPNAPANGQTKPMVTVTQLTIVPSGVVRVSGLVLSNSNGTVQIEDGGGLQLTINASGAKVTKGQNTAATVNDIQVGNQITVDGTQNGATVTANTVRIFDPTAPRPNRPNKGTASPSPTT